MYCGIDLAVKRKTTIGVLNNYEIRIYEVSTNEEIIQLCSKANITAIDSPLSHSKGFRNVDKEMIRRGFRVLPPSFISKLVERAIELSRSLKNVIETHPTSTLKNLGINWRRLHEVKDYVDAAACAMVALGYEIGYVEEIKANDGVIYLLSKNFPYELKRKDYYTFYLKEAK